MKSMQALKMSSDLTYTGSSCVAQNTYIQSKISLVPNHRSFKNIFSCHNRYFKFLLKHGHVVHASDTLLRINGATA